MTERCIRIMADKVSNLPEDEKQVITLRYGLDLKGHKSAKEVAQILEMSETQVSNIEVKALRKLRW